MGTLLHDLRYAVRTLRRSPSFSIPVLLSLALAIGANLAAFGFLNALALRPLPVREPDRLFRVHATGEAGVSGAANYVWFEQVRDRARSVAGVLQLKTGLRRVVVGDQVESLLGQEVTGDYFETLGLTPLAGRLIRRSDQRATGSDRVAVIGEAYWARRFNRDPGVLGRTILIDRTPHQIVGVVRGGFFGLQAGRRVEVTTPMDGSRYGLGEWLEMPLIVRLAPGVTREAAATELGGLLQQYAGLAKVSTRERARWFRDVELRPVANGLADLRDQYLEPAVTVWIIVGVMLLLACSNWAMLLMSRAAALRREHSVRLALGATRLRLAGQALLESLLLAVGGGALGLFASFWALELFGRFLPEQGFPVVLEVAPDLRVFGFALALSVTTGLLFGAVPAWLRGRVRGEDLRTTRVTFDARGSRIGRGLVVFQVAVSLVLVVAASLFTATLRNLRTRDMGVGTSAVLMLRLDADDTGLEGERLSAAHRQILEEVRTIPGILSASLASITPLSGDEDGKPLGVAGFTPASPDDLVAQVNTVGPAYFTTFDIPVLRGRGIGAGDVAGAPSVALLSEAAARLFFAGTDPIGKRVDIGGAVRTRVEVVGVVKDVMDRDLRTEPARMVYVPFFQRYAEGAYTLALRTDDHSETLVRWVQSVVNRVAPELSVGQVRSLARQIDERLVNERVLAAVSAGFGGLALVLAGFGVLGVIAYSVSARTRELGVRMALGADRARVLRLFVGQGMRLATLGVAIGLVLALGTTHTLGSRLFGISPTNWAVLAGASALLCALALLASWIPARRAARVDPTMALQSD